MKDTKEAVKVYESLARPPKDALREIQAGKLKGKTDINPQWRYKAMTEKFGLVGIGWKYEVQKLWTEQGAGNEKLAFAQIAVFLKNGETWSEPIVGIGGSRLVALEKGAAVSNDEGYKMAVTDAFSTALKMIGVAADIYAGRWNGTKYKNEPQENAQTPQPPKQAAKPKQPAKLPFTPKGGESTPEEKARIKELCEAKYADGKRIFSNEEIKTYSGYRQTKTARELIAFIENALRNRRGDAPELPPAEPAPPAQPSAEDLAEQALTEAQQPSFDTMQPVEGGESDADQAFDIF